MCGRCDLSPKDPEQTTLHRIVREHLADFLAAREAAGASMPAFVRDELFGFLRCGVAAHGVALFRCSACNASRVVALSCKGRGFCPRCLGRRMTELALEWTRWVLPRVRIRQWVLSLPFWLRVPLAYRHALALEVHAVAARVIERWYRKKAKQLGVDGRTGMITVIQRFGSDLACNLHYHLIVNDGVHDALGGFTALAAPTMDEMTALATRIAARVTRLLERRSLDEDIDESERSLCAALARSARRQGAIAHADPEREPDQDADRWAGLIKARVEGFDLECTTVVRGDDRERLEQLCKYVLRAPLADRRLRLLATGEVALELKTAWNDGTRWVTMSADTFLERLCSLVPREREHTTLYRGTLGPHAARRAKVVPHDEGPRPKNLTWANLMMHGLSVDVLACACGARMKYVAVVREKQSLARLLRLHRLAQRATPIAPARAPPQTDLDFGP